MYSCIDISTAMSALRTGTIIEACRRASDLEGVYYVEGTMRLIDGRRIRFEVYSARQDFGCATIAGHMTVPTERMVNLFIALSGVDIWHNEEAPA